MADMRIHFTILGLVLFLILGVTATRGAKAFPSEWENVLRQQLPLFGHRNWIVIADSAYPMQASDGIQTVVANASQTQVLREVLEQLSKAKHVRPIIHLDSELSAVPEKDAPGVDAYRQQLKEMLPTTGVSTLPHEEIIRQLDQASQTFQVLIIKTNMTIPYTSVFLQLDCGYWSAEAESRLRTAMNSRH